MHLVPTNTALSKVVVLEIAGGLGEAQFIQLVVVAIAQVEQLHDRGLAVSGWVLRGQIHGEIKDAERREVAIKQVEGKRLMYKTPANPPKLPPTPGEQLSPFPL